MNYKETYPSLPLAEKLRRIQKGLTTEPLFSAAATLRFVNAPILSAIDVFDDVQMTNHKSIYFALKTEYPHDDPNDITFGAVAELLATSLHDPLTENGKKLAKAFFECFNDAKYLDTEDGKEYIGDHSLMPLNEFLKSVPYKEYEDFLRIVEESAYEKNASARENLLNFIGHSIDETLLGKIYAAFEDRNPPEDKFRDSNATTIRLCYGPLVDLFVIPIAEISQKHIDIQKFLQQNLQKKETSDYDK